MTDAHFSFTFVFKQALIITCHALMVQKIENQRNIDIEGVQIGNRSTLFTICTPRPIRLKEAGKVGSVLLSV